MIAAGPLARADSAARDAFDQGVQAYQAGGFDQAAAAFREAATNQPAPGVLHNLGNAEWRAGRAGAAILAWEQAQWLDPFNPDTRGNLRFARKAAQVEGPELAWYELCSAWLPGHWWATVAAVSFWLAVALVLLPGVFRWRKADWQQGAAAAGLALFLLTLPALAGVHGRSRLGIVLQKDTPLRLTPTTQAQVLTKLPAGEAARWERRRGNYVFIRTGNAGGWVEQAQFGLITGGN